MSEFALQAVNLAKVYTARGKAPTRAIDGMSFAVPRGIIFGLLGPNGAGKSTLLRIFATLTRPSSGTANVLGFDVVRSPLDVRRRIAAVIQETAAELLLSVRDNLLTYARFRGLERTVALRRAEAVTEAFHLTEDSERKVQDLSGGFRRRVQVAKVFLVETPVLFLDEFSTGMDPILKRQVMDQLRTEVRKGRTIILTTQILSEAEELCDDILIMNQGQQVARGDLNTLKLLSQGVYEIAMTFDRLPPTIAQELAHLHPLRTFLDSNTLEVAFKAADNNILEVVSSLARNRRVLRMEVRGASLEDIFIELTTSRRGAQ